MSRKAIVILVIAVAAGASGGGSAAAGTTTAARASDVTSTMALWREALQHRATHCAPGLDPSISVPTP